jgi:hypothetical protein
MFHLPNQEKGLSMMRLIIVGIFSDLLLGRQKYENNLRQNKTSINRKTTMVCRKKSNYIPYQEDQRFVQGQSKWAWFTLLLTLKEKILFFSFSLVFLGNRRKS